jgi:hypothetical protein
MSLHKQRPLTYRGFYILTRGPWRTPYPLEAGETTWRKSLHNPRKRSSTVERVLPCRTLLYCTQLVIACVLCCPDQDESTGVRPSTRYSGKHIGETLISNLHLKSLSWGTLTYKGAGGRALPHSSRSCSSSPINDPLPNIIAAISRTSAQLDRGWWY